MTPNYLLTTHGNPNTTSARFAGICTMDAINPLLNEGWNMVSTESKRYRKTERGPYVSHLVKLTHPDLKGTSESIGPKERERRDLSVCAHGGSVSERLRQRYVRRSARVGD